MSKNSSEFYLHAKKSLGQNFLADASVIQNILQSTHDFLSLKKISYPKILEIGPGTGILTKALLQNKENPYSITAVEKDHRAIKGLNDTLLKQYPSQFTLIDADVLQYSPKQFDMCVGNIPYYITSDILMWLCDHKNKFLGAIFMVQDEVADRLCAHTNTKEYSRLSIKMQLNFEIKKLFKVSKDCFVPRPKVNSAIVLFVPNAFSFLNEKEENDFESFTTLLFSQRRKMLRRIFSENFKIITADKIKQFWNTLSQINIIETDRPESISPKNMLELFYLYQKFLSV